MERASETLSPSGQEEMALAMHLKSRVSSTHHNLLIKIYSAFLEFSTSLDYSNFTNICQIYTYPAEANRMATVEYERKGKKD
ncbi:hypothetical protein SK128_026428 [Halocaridina rubra]|uniref:Uncharacterized protein n=1 Tax=Halocaridina rubra TaxID=373956 RepID=A0AAN8XCE1_HALRR